MLNYKHNCMLCSVFIKGKCTPLKWGRVKNFSDTDFQLHLKLCASQNQDSPWRQGVDLKEKMQSGEELAGPDSSVSFYSSIPISFFRPLSLPSALPPCFCFSLCLRPLPSASEAFIPQCPCFLIVPLSLMSSFRLDTLCLPSIQPVWDFSPIAALSHFSA